MEEYRKILEEELLKLERIKQAAEQDIKNAPPGTLRISNKGNFEQYYWRTNPKDTRGKYIRKTEKELIKNLAQKEYAQKMLVLLEPMIVSKRRGLQIPDGIEMQRKMEKVYGKLSSYKQKLVIPYVDTEDEFAAIWEEEQKIKKEKTDTAGKSSETTKEIFTEKGECVRSKSEKILADKLYMLGIPYVYEVPLHLQGYGYIKPDFTVLNKRTRRTYYWEHLGMMDDKGYCESAIKKIESLEKNNIFPGKNLILTYETKDHPLNMKIVEKLIKEYLS